MIRIAALALLFATPAHAYGRATDPMPKPEERPLLDCWITETQGTDCRIVETRK